MLFVTEAQVREHLPMAKCIELMREAFLHLADGRASNQGRRRLMAGSGSILHYMAGATEQYFGIKCYSTNAATGAHFTFLLYRRADGEPLATFEANALGQIRTGAVSGLATDLLAREDAETACLIGSGFQAETQVEAIRAIRNIRDFRVWSRNAQKRTEFAKRHRLRAMETAQEAVEGADIVITATSSKEPVLDAAWVKPRAHVNAMGSNWANRRELPGDLVNSAGLVVVDDRDAGLVEAGDLLQSGLPAEKWVELKEIAAGKVSPPGGEQVTIFKSSGLAVEDVAAAGYVYEQVILAQVTPAQGSGLQHPATH